MNSERRVGVEKFWFTSDTHFGHGNIMKYSLRPGLTVDEHKSLAIWQNNPRHYFKVSQESIARMDDYLIDGINQVVGENDTLWHLGDFCFAQKNEYLKVAKQYRDRIKCRNVHLVFGNHDNYPLGQLFSSSQDMATISCNGQSIVLLHYAMAVWNKSHRGAWHLYGHSHAGAEKWLDEKLVGRRSFDVGVDNAKLILGEYRPWSFDEVKKIMDARTGASIDHHKE